MGNLTPKTLGNGKITTGTPEKTLSANLVGGVYSGLGGTRLEKPRARIWENRPRGKIESRL